MQRLHTTQYRLLRPTRSDRPRSNADALSLRYRKRRPLQRESSVWTVIDVMDKSRPRLVVCQRYQNKLAYAATCQRLGIFSLRFPGLLGLLSLAVVHIWDSMPTSSVRVAILSLSGQLYCSPTAESDQKISCLLPSPVACTATLYLLFST